MTFGKVCGQSAGCVRVSFCCGLLVFFAPLVEAAQWPDVRPLDARERGQTDRFSSRSLDAPQAAFRLPTREDLAGWVLTRTPLPRETERRFAAEADRPVRERHDLEPAPDLAAHVLKKLMAELPPRAAGDLPYRLQILAGDEGLAGEGGRAFTTGEGQIYLHGPWLEALTRHERGATDRLAFVVGRELGHLVRGHVQTRFQLLWLNEELASTLARPAEAAWIEQALRDRFAAAGKTAPFLYDDAETQSADLFALHLCRNAGYDLENALDVLRAEIRAEAELELAPGEFTPSLRSATRRLNALRRELDGSMRSESFGLFEYDRRTAELSPVADAALSGEDDVVICIHGMASGLRVYRPLALELAGRPEFAGTRILGFQYPSGESLAGVAQFLRRELRRTAREGEEIGEHVDFVCHSAGGLVVRYFTEVLDCPIRSAILQGTPHDGSNLAALKPLLDAREFCAQFDLGDQNRAARAIRDVQGQIGYDVQPGSLFLRQLDRHHKPEHSERYVIHRGQALSGRTALLCVAGSAILRHTLRNELNGSARQTALARAAQDWVGSLNLPAEIVAGDLAVSLESAELDDVKSVITFRVNHAELPRAPGTIGSVAEILTQTAGRRMAGN